MRKLILAAGVLAALALTGCIQIETDAVIDENGAGTIAMTYTVSLEVEAAMKELAGLDTGMDEDMGEPPIFAEDFDIDELKSELKEYDVRVKDYSNTTDAGARTIHIALAFDGPDGLQAALEITLGEEGAMGLRRMDDGNYYIGTVESTIAAFEEDEEEDYSDMEDMGMEDMGAAMENAARSMELMGVLMSHSGDMKVTTRITVPGDVVRHNASAIDGRTMVWSIDASNMMSGATDSPEIVFSGKGLSLDVPAY